MRRLVFAAMMLCAVSSYSLGGIITLVPESDLSALGTFTPIDTTTITPLAAGLLDTEVYSQAFYDANTQEYAYLYQVDNRGSAGNHPVEEFTLYPFASRIQVGYLNSTATLPAASLFLSGGQVPESTGFEAPGLLESFYYGSRSGHEIVPGNHSLVMYITSKNSPGEITGNVIDGAVASGTVVGAVPINTPEPSAIVLLISCGLGFWSFKRFRRR